MSSSSLNFLSLSGRFALLVSAVMLGACATGPSADLPPAPATPTAVDYTYVIGAGDSLNVIVWRNPELSMAVPVRPDGKVSAPLVEELQAQGKTPVELARDI